MKTGVFIVESLNLADEEKELFEGKILTQMLNMLGIEARYVYIRTKQELEVFIKRFEESDFKYLHLSCHGNGEGIGMTLDEYSFPFSELSDMFQFSGKGKRLFLSSCSVMNGDNIVDEMLDTQFLSITGPLDEVGFAESAIFWASFYHLMFIENESRMDNEYMKNTIENLSSTFNIAMSIVIKIKNSKCYNRYIVKENTLEKVN